MYQKLMEAWGRELSTQTLQPLDQRFYNDLAEYVKNLRDRLKEAQGVQRTLLEEEVNNLKRILNKLVDLRVEKMFQTIAATGELNINLLAEAEAKLGKALNQLVKEVKALKLLPFVKPEEAADSMGKTILRFIKPIPRIVCTDLKAYGPFNPEDIATLPSLDAEKLVERGVAVRVKPFEDV